ncbi:hypothetical protein [Salmonella enterica]|uniref:hypothetical protein n=1 Tax=Salmonella enterica TaxID=28901 RepID=UPI001C018098|nr:hypothetical protein [Salmonella enterica]MBT9354958.1 hypothetical protein [Salmonella enterica subsp. enterica serovar Typhimurium]
MSAFDRDSALAAGLKGNANRTPEQASNIGRAAALARWQGHEPKRQRYPLLSGAELDHWVLQIPLEQRRDMSRPQIRRRATMLARQAAAQAAVEAAKPPVDDGFALLRLELEGKQ